MEENSKAPPSGNPRTGYQKPFPSFGMFHSLDGAELIGLGCLWLSETDSRPVPHTYAAPARQSHATRPLWREVPFLELAKRRGQNVSERIGARAGNQQAEGKEQFGERKFVPAVIDIKTMRQVNKKDGAEHDDHHADCSDPQKSAGEHGRGSGELGQADEIADSRRRVHECGKVRRTRSAENAKKNAAAVIEKWERAGYAQDQP